MDFQRSGAYKKQDKRLTSKTKRVTFTVKVGDRDLISLCVFLCV